MLNTSGEETKQRILKVLENHPEGLTIQNLSELLNLHRQTAVKYLLVLEAVGDAVSRRIGAVSLWYSKDLFNKLKRLVRR